MSWTVSDRIRFLYAMVGSSGFILVIIAALVFGWKMFEASPTVQSSKLLIAIIGSANTGLLGACIAVMRIALGAKKRATNG